ncbi:MAG: GntR family transcriptional regulator [Clostridia bacterium]|nr:GntR family transcriptional regulator [Clostridia bacterium]
MEKENETLSLYESVKLAICRGIYEGTWQDGERIPTERRLTETLGVSRITVRKALEQMEKEGVIERTQGSGTRVTLKCEAHSGSMDIITLIAPAHNAFFSRLIDAIELRAEQEDALVLYRQKPDGMTLAQCLFRIYEKGLRNVILWKEGMDLPPEAMKRLCALGMRMVLFDSTRHTPYADAVTLDNPDAVRRLIECLRARGCRRPAYVGWDAAEIDSVPERENAFRTLCPQGTVVRVPYLYHSRPEDIPPETRRRLLEQTASCDGFLFGVGELAAALLSSAESGPRRPAAAIGGAPGVRETDMLILEQDFPGMAEKMFELLKTQNTSGSGWQAGTYRLPGLCAFGMKGEEGS